MFTHRIVVYLPIVGLAVVFFECSDRTLPTEGKEKAYSPTVYNIVEFDFSEILESEITNYELV
jgi:hypothetical protein